MVNSESFQQSLFNMEDSTKHHEVTVETCLMDHSPKARGQGNYGFSKKDDKSIWVKCELPYGIKIRLNPVVTLFSVMIIWGLVVVSFIMGTDLPFSVWLRWLVERSSWLVIGSINAWLLFTGVLYFSKFSSLKLGKDDEKPQYSNVTWFSMIFSASIGSGFFYWAGAEASIHYLTKNKHTTNPFITDNELAQKAISQTLVHWGFQGWNAFLLVAILVGLLGYREGLPMTMKSCFYPLLGNRIFGWIGDFIDVFIIVTTLFGVCTVLGLGVRQINMGLTLISDNIPEDDITAQIILIWIITSFATSSTLSGQDKGIRRLSEIAFVIGIFLTLTTLCLLNTSFFLNLYVQSLGHYFLEQFTLGFATHAFEQATPSHGAEDRGRFLPEGIKSTDGPEAWIDDWSMFYFCWWIVLAPFIGTFIAKISRGRTIKEVITVCILVPTFYVFFVLLVFSGAAFQLEREAAGEGLCCQDEQGWFIADLEGEMLKQNVDSNSIPKSGDAWMCQGDSCGSCATTTLEHYHSKNITLESFISDAKNLGKDFGSALIDRSRSRISCHSMEQRYFDILRAQGPPGFFLCVFSLFAIIFYFVTTSDSGSLVVDCLSANGDPEPPKLQRIFWSGTEGAVATALLVAGGKKGLVAMLTMVVMSGVPLTVLFWFIVVSIWRTCKVCSQSKPNKQKQFESSIFEPFASKPYSDLRLTESLEEFALFIINIILAPITLAKVNLRIYTPKKAAFYSFIVCISFLGFLIIAALSIAYSQIWPFALFSYLCFVSMVTLLRMEVREKLDIDGHPVEDALLSLVLYPSAAIQMDKATITTDKEKETETI